jgi:hypothetical protein
MEFRKSRPVSLKAHATYNEKWLQSLIAGDPGVLGLGDLIVKDVERRQPRAGRLDLLLSNPETLTRYEVGDPARRHRRSAHHQDDRVLAYREDPLPPTSTWQCWWPKTSPAAS